eukprot:scaffold14974_cov195-Amphora_coffeaeformis.AAC.36
MNQSTNNNYYYYHWLLYSIPTTPCGEQIACNQSQIQRTNRSIDRSITKYDDGKPPALCCDMDSPPVCLVAKAIPFKRSRKVQHGKYPIKY